MLNQMPLGCGVPQPPKPPKVIRVSESEEGKYQLQNTLSVTCPINYQLISGGCQSEPQPEPRLYWLLPSLKPENDTYHCVANMDKGSTTNYYRGLTASATCLHNDYIQDIVISTCEGVATPYTSECIASCPAGYEVTGGGCASNDTTAKYPWKVTMSYPYQDTNGIQGGWNCKVSEDATTGLYNKKAQGYAVCVQYTEGVVADQKIVSEYSGTAEKYGNGAIAQCPIGYEVVGGGCSTRSHGNTKKEWKIVETLPSRDERGWSCFASENLGTNTYNQDVRTDALCMRFK